MEIKKDLHPAGKLGFKGYQHKKTDEGSPAYKFNFLYDHNNWDCYVEFYKVNQNPHDFSYSVRKQNNKMEPFSTKKLSPNGVTIDTVSDLKLSNSEPVAYRYKLVGNQEHNKDKVRYLKDDDASVCGDGCNLIVRKGTSVVKQGPMCLGIPDSFNPGYVYAGFHADNTGEIIKNPDAKDLSSFSRTFSNKAGGTIAGIQQKLPDLRKAGYKRFIGTPTTGGDNVSSHKYWIKRANQTENIDNYISFQKELFKNGMNLVSDSAYTSQGLEGVNFQYAIRWMNQADKPHEYYMFRMQGLEDAALGLGVVPKNMNNLRHKVVNHPNTFEQEANGQIKIGKNNEYDPSQPTYIQAYDDSLVSDAQRKDNKNLIRNYDKTNASIDGEQNNLAINAHDDTLVSNAFAINPSEYTANIKNLNTINKNRGYSEKIDLNSPMGTLVLAKFSGIEIRPKDEGGFVTWDSNTDMAKLSYTESDYDTQMLESIKNPKERALESEKLARAHAGNRDALTDTMRFWTKLVRNVNTEYTAKTLGNLGNSPDEAADRINSLIYNRDNQLLPDDVAINDNTIENIFYNDYKLRNKEVLYDKALDKALMDVPLDSIELADDTVGALSSPYLSKRSPDLEHVGISRYEAMNDSTYVVPEKYAKTYNKMNKVIMNQIHNFATSVLSEVDKNSKEKLFEKNDTLKLTEYGQYVVPLVASDIMKYAMIKSLVPNAETKQLKDGRLTYDYENLTEKATLQSIGIVGDSPEDEANQIVNKIKTGVEHFDKADAITIAKSINKRLEGTNALSFRFAEAMVDKSGLGLDHRVDAAKDVADMDALRSMQDHVDNQMSEVIKIWEKPCAAVKEENPNSLIVFEFTDLWDMMRATYSKEYIDDNSGDVGKNHPDAIFKHAGNLARTILLESGANSEANYDHFFTAGVKTFGKDFVKGVDPNDCDNSTEEKRVGLLSGSLDKFAEMPMDYKRNAYTFGGNHDKPRMIECFSMDMELFHANLNKKDSKEAINHRKTAYMIMNDIMDENGLDANAKNIINHSEDYFNNVSAKAIAKADLIRSSFGIANNIITNERLQKAHDDKAREDIRQDSNRIYAAISKSIKDVVNGDFYLNGENNNKDKSVADSYKKQLEKDGFGSKALPTALGIVMQQAKHKYGLMTNTYMNNAGVEKEYTDLIEKVALGIPMAKARMYNQMISAIPGNPTVYAGDEFGMTGYDEKNKNLYLNNRDVIPWETVVVEKNDKGENINIKYKEHIAKHKEAMDGVIATRKDDIEHKMEAMNNGTMHRLHDLYGKDARNNEGNLRCPAIVSQAANGSMNISVFNYNGIPLENPLLGRSINSREDLNEIINEVKPTPVKFDKFVIDGIKAGHKLEIPVDIEFKNIESNDPSVYKTAYDDKGNLILKRVMKDGKEEGVYIGKETAPEGVLRLYYQPKEVEEEIAQKKELEKKYTPSFKGVRKYYNPTYNIAVSNPYSVNKSEKTGQNLSLVAR